MRQKRRGLDAPGFTKNKNGHLIIYSGTELILDGKPKTVDISPFRFSRFAEGKLLEGKYGYGNIWK
jgi:hypothetical protein